VDPDYISHHEKLAIIQRDLEDCYTALQLISRESLQGQDYLGYLGILDYIKQHTLCLFHVLTYPERFGNFTADDEYLKFRNIAIELISTNTKAFYQACIGQRFDPEFSSTDHLANLKELIVFVGTLERDYRQYTLQEVDHPIRMMVHVNQLLQMYPETNTIIPVMSGGTQSALLATEGLKLQKTEKLPLTFLPLSTHSAKMNFGNVFTLQTLLLFLSQSEDLIKGQNILVTEDNSNSGQTAQMIYAALITLGARSVHISFVEIDPHRIMYKQSSEREKKSEYVSNYLHRDFKSAVGVLPVARYLKQDYQLRKMYVWRLFNSYKKNE
jgi:hypoxanthine-guanine phosphoribosyltransferase